MNPLLELDNTLSQIRQDIRFSQFKIGKIIKLIENENKLSDKEKIELILKIAKEIDKNLVGYD